MSRWLPRLGCALGVFMSSVSAFAQADNDHFANRTELAGTNLTFLAPTLAATVEAGEPNHAGPDFQATASIWWNWTAPADGHLLLRREPGGPGALAIYSGDQLGQLKRLGGTLREFTELVPVTVGTRYSIAVSERPNPNQFVTGFHRIGLKFFPTLANDQFAGRQPLAGESVVFEAQRPGATRELGEPVHFGGTNEHTRWFTWQAPVSGTVSLKVVPAEGGTLVGCRLAAYEGTQLAQLSRVTGDSLEQLNAAAFTPLIFEAVAGRIYQLAAVDIMADRGELHYQYPNCRLELSLSQLRLASPTDGLFLPQSADLTVEVAGPLPAGPLEFMLLDNRSAQGSLSPSEGPWIVESLPAGPHEFRMIVRDGNGRDYYTPKAVVTVGLPNDHFANRQLLSGNRFEASLDTRGATFEAGEPAFPGFPQPGSVWFSWTAPADGVLATPQGPPWDAFTGGPLGVLRAQPVFAPDWPSGERRLAVEAGQTYHLRFVDIGWRTPRQGQPFEFHPAPANDRFGQATELPGEAVDLPVSTWNATIDASEAAIPTGNDHYRASIWYAWTAPGRGRMWALTDAGEIAIHASEPAPIGPRLTLPGPAEVRVEPGQRYLLRLLGGLPGFEGRLSLQFRPGLANDDFSAARRLQGTFGELLDNNRFATTEPGEVRNFSFAGHTLWYSFTAPANGTLVVSVTHDSDPEEPSLAVATGYPELTVLQGTSLGLLQEVPSPSAPNRPPVVGGNTYWIRLDHTRDRIGGRVRIRYAFLPENFNDSFSKTWNFGSPKAEQFIASTWGATREEGEPRHGGESSGASVWWGWSAPANGSVRWWTTGAAKPPRLAVFTGDSLRSLVPVSSYAHDGTNAVATFSAVAGQYYRLVLDYPQAWREEPQYAVVSNTLQFTSLRITSPTPGAAVTQSPVFRISAPVPAWDGTVQEVEYFLSKSGPPSTELGQSLGTTRSAPFALQPGVIPQGSHRVTAVARMADGTTRTTEPVLFHLGPPNDSLANAQRITSRAADLTGSLVGTTVEPGEPVLNWNGDRGSVWYRWIPPVTGLAELRVEGSHWYGVYRGTGFVDFQPIPLQFSEPPRRASFAIEAGVSYWVVVKLQNESLETGFKFQLAAQSVTLAEPAAGSVWPVGTELQLHAVTEEPPGAISQVEFLVGDAVAGAAGQPPYVTRWRAENVGLFPLRTRTRFTSGEEVISPPTPVHIGPTNDAIAFAEVVAGSEILLRGSTLGATPDLGVPGVFQGYPSVWHRWVAPAAGQVEISGTGGSAFSAVIFTVLEGEPLPQVPAGVSEFNVSFLILKVRAGVTYWIGFSSPPEPNTGEYDYRLTFSPAPSNDAFGRRIAVTANPPEMLVNSIAATAEPGEPPHGNAPAGASVWWTWTPDSDGTARIRFPEGFPVSPARVAVYVGDSLGNLQPVGQFNTTGFGEWQPFPVRAGQAHQIAFDDYTGVTKASRMQIEFNRSPANDRFASRLPISGDYVRVSAYGLGATLEPGEPEHHPGWANTGSQWWSWRAPRAGTVRLRTANLGSPPALTVYRGTALDRVEHVAGTGNLGNQYQHVLNFSAEAGVEYVVAADSLFGPPVPFELELVLYHEVERGNDLFDRRQRLTGEQVRFLTDNLGATREFQEPFHGGEYGGRSVWYAWRAPADGIANLEILKGDLNDPSYPLLGVYSGSSIATLRAVAGGAGNESLGLTFETHAGEDYAIAVDALAGRAGVFDFHLRLAIPDQPVTLGLVTPNQGQFNLQVSGLAGRSGVIEDSADLVSWDEVGRFPGGNDGLTYPLPVISEQTSVIFYRVRLK